MRSCNREHHGAPKKLNGGVEISVKRDPDTYTSASKEPKNFAKSSFLWVELIALRTFFSHNFFFKKIGKTMSAMLSGYLTD